MRDKRQALVFVAVGTLALLIAVHWSIQKFRAADSILPTETPAPKAIMLQDPEPHAPPCDFWRPWQALVAPGTPHDYLTRLKHRLEEPSTRSGEYLNLINRDHSVLDGATESICIKGRFQGDGAYQLDVGEPEACAAAPVAFLDLNVMIRVERLEEGGFINDLTVNVGLADIKPAGVTDFFAKELAMMSGGYRGWSGAFPAYHTLNTAGFGPVGSGTEPDGTAKLRYFWLTQPMRSWLPRWSDYLLELGDLVSIRTDFVDSASTKLMHTDLNTIVSGIEFAMPNAAVVYLQAPHDTTLTVTHDIDVRFRGLEIGLTGMKFSGTLKPSPGALVYDGKFAGVTAVKIGGAYRGMSGGALGDMIKKLVEEKVFEEIQRLTRGNRGTGWTFHLSHETVEGGQNVFTYKTSLQSPVNFLNLVRQDKDSTDSAVLPGKLALQELNRWSVSSVDALVKDVETCQ